MPNHVECFKCNVLFNLVFNAILEYVLVTHAGSLDYWMGSFSLPTWPVVIFLFLFLFNNMSQSGNQTLTYGFMFSEGACSYSPFRGWGDKHNSFVDTRKKNSKLVMVVHMGLLCFYHILGVGYLWMNVSNAVPREIVVNEGLIVKLDAMTFFKISGRYVCKVCKFKCRFLEQSGNGDCINEMLILYIL